MRKRSLTSLGETEMEVLGHVWDLRRATVADVHERILASRPLAYTTVMTVMKKLADKGYLACERTSTAYVYEPAIRPEDVQHSLVRDLVSKVFGGSPAALVQTLVGHENLSETEREEIVTMINKMDTGDGDTT